LFLLVTNFSRIKNLNDIFFCLAVLLASFSCIHIGKMLEQL